MDSAQARHNMVEGQLRANEVTDPRLLEAMGRLPRERFLPKSRQALAYIDECVPVAERRYLMEPRCFAKLLQAAEIRDSDVALDVGCASGYSTAVIAALAGAVVALESDETLAKMASDILTHLGIDTATVVAGPLEQGCVAQSPFDVIVLNGSVEVIPEVLFDQLAAGGRLAAVVENEMGSHAMVYTKTAHGKDSTVSSRIVFDAKIAPLRGFAAKPQFVF